jgi:hypothetical protein
MPPVEPPSTLLVIALDPVGEPTFAVVAIEDGRGRRPAGRTLGARGLPLERSSMNLPSRLIAVTEQEPRWVGAVVLAEMPPSGVVEIQLERGCVLAGTVVDPSGQPVPGIRVVALDPLRRASWVHAYADGLEPESDGRWARTETGGDGRFELTGLLPGVDYDLWAAGQGFLVNDGNPFTARRYSCGEEELVLQAHPLYGAILRATPDRAESALRAVLVQGIESTPQAFPSYSLDGGRYALVSSNPALMGTALEAQAREAQERGLMVIAWISHKDKASLPADVKTTPFFFAEGTHRVDVPRVRDRLDELVVNLGAPRDLGTLYLHLIAPLGGLERLDPDLKVAALELVSIQEPTLRLRIPIRVGPAVEGFTVSGIPTGSYEWKLKNGLVLLPGPDERPGLLHVAESGGSLLLDLSWTGMLELKIHDKDGVSVTAPVQANLTLAETRKVLRKLPGGVEVSTSVDNLDMAWTAPPYVLPFLPPGEWYVECQSAMGQRLRGGHRGPVLVHAGDLTQAEIQTKQN